MAKSDMSQDNGPGAASSALDGAIRLLAGYPSYWALLWLLLCGAGVALCLAYRPLRLDMSFDSLELVDVNAAVNQNAFLAAMEASAADDNRTHQVFDVQVVYRLNTPPGHQGILQAPILRQIVKLERQLCALPKWSSTCAGVEAQYQPLCSAGLSFANYALVQSYYAAADVIPTSIIPNGLATDPLPLATSVELLRKRGLREVVVPRIADVTVDASGALAAPVTDLRSVFRFRLPRGDDAREQENRMRFESLVKDELVEFLDKAKTKFEGTELDVHMDADGMREREAGLALKVNLIITACTSFLTPIILAMQTHSGILTVAGLLAAWLPVPLAMAFCSLVTGVTEVSASLALAAIVSVPLCGLDCVLAYTDTFRASARVCADSDFERVSWTYRQAGSVMLGKTIFVVFLLLFNLMSVFKPLRLVGLYLGLYCAISWTVVSVVYLPLCLADERFRVWQGLSKRRSSEVLTCVIDGQMVFAEVGKKRLASEDPQGLNKTHLLKYTMGHTGQEWVRLDERNKLLHSETLSRIGQQAFAYRIDVWTRTERLMARLAFKMRHWRLSLCVVPVLAVVACMYLSVWHYRWHSDAFSPFPEHHNQYQMSEALKRFVPLGDLDVQPPPLTEKVCNVTREGTGCSLFWCEAITTQEGAYVSDTSCACQRHERSGCGSATAVTARERVVGPLRVSGSLLDVVGSYVAGALSTGVSLEFAQLGQNLNVSAEAVSHVLLHNWERDTFKSMHVSEVEVSLRRDAGAPNASCGWDDLCFCGAESCRLSQGSWRVLPDALRLVPAGRRLAGAEAPGQVVVDVIFGLHVDASPSGFVRPHSPRESWRYLDGFRLSEPHLLRDMRQLCTSVPQELRIKWRACWIEEFYDFLLARGERFPPTLARFDGLFGDFMATRSTDRGTNSRLAQQYLWMRRADFGATFLSFAVDAPPTLSNAAVREYMGRWDAFIADYRGGASSSFAKGAICTSDSWAIAEAQGELFSSTVLTLGLAMASALVVMVVFLHSCSLSAFVVVAALGPFTGLVAFMVVAMKWTMEPAEATILVILGAGALTHPFQVVSAYSLLWLPPAGGPLEAGERAALRMKLVSQALSTSGPTVAGAALASVGCGALLMCCSLPLFSKLGASMVVLAALQALTALVPLPAALLMAGPLGPDGRKGCDPRKGRLLRATQGGGPPPEPEARESQDQSPTLVGAGLHSRSRAEEPENPRFLTPPASMTPMSSASGLGPGDPVAEAARARHSRSTS